MCLPFTLDLVTLEVRDMGGGTGENPIRRESLLLGGGALPQHRVLGPPEPQENWGWAPALTEKKGGAKGARERRPLGPEPHTAGTPQGLSHVDPRAGVIPTSQATSPEPQIQPGPPGAKCS